MRRSNFGEMHCSIAQTLERIGDWWTLLILRDLYAGLQRFDELAGDLGISRNLLTLRLRHLVDSGIISRELYQERPPRHRYTLTEAGQDLIPILMALTAWGDRWATPPGGPPLRFRHTSCGHHFVPEVTCSECGEAVDPDGVRLEPGPGGRAAPGTNLIGKALSGQTTPGAD